MKEENNFGMIFMLIILQFIAMIGLAYLVLTLDKGKLDGSFNVYNPEVIEASVIMDVRQKNTESDLVYEANLKMAFNNVTAVLEQKAGEKPLYALGARVGGADITDEILKEVNISRVNSLSGINDFSAATGVGMEAAKKELIEAVNSAIKKQEELQMIP